MRRSGKYNAHKTTIDGICFDSQMESRRYQELKLLESAGKIYGLVLQPRFELIKPYTNGAGRRIKALYYVADFGYTVAETKEYVIEDVKGHRTDAYRLKKKLFEKVMFPIVINEVTA